MRKCALRDRHFDEAAGRNQTVNDARRAAGQVCEIGFGANQTVCGNAPGRVCGQGSSRGRGRTFVEANAEAGFGGSNAASALIIIRATMPSGANV